MEEDKIMDNSQFSDKNNNNVVGTGQSDKSTLLLENIIAILLWTKQEKLFNL
jgi:hypothetical protein